MRTTIAFHGAAGTVTGSRHLIHTGKSQILVDCGLFQGAHDTRAMNWEPSPFDPQDLDAVILTHAHTDHIGLLPRLVKEGLRCPIYATFGTVEIARIALPDSGRLQEEEARYRNRHGITRHNPALPLYTEADAYEALKRLAKLHFHQWQDLPGKATFRFLPAGHILGSAFAEIYFENGERILMSGDLGRYDRPILKDPTPVEFAEHLVMESTYGDRLHSDRDALDVLENVLNDAYASGGCVLVPSFAIGRTQELLWYINELEEQGRMPKMPVYIDSPMANATTLLFFKDQEDFDADMKRDMAEGSSPLKADRVRFVRDREASKALNSMDGPMMIISGSGMLTGGRAIHHLKRRGPDPANTILFTGYQAEGTKGREILDGAEEVFVHKEPVPIRAKVEMMDMLSAHADYQEMLKWLSGFKEAPRTTFLVHGENGPRESLATKIREELGWKVECPRLGQRFDLG